MAQCREVTCHVSGFGLSQLPLPAPGASQESSCSLSFILSSVRWMHLTDHLTTDRPTPSGRGRGQQRGCSSFQGLTKIPPDQPDSLPVPGKLAK
jgi:hypothetical protein